MEAKEIAGRLKIIGAYVHYDEEGDTLYVNLGNQAQDSLELAEDVIVDLDEKGRPVGLTILNFERRMKERQAPSSHQ